MSSDHHAAERPRAVDRLLMALVPVMFSYSRWNAAVYVAEIRDRSATCRVRWRSALAPRLRCALALNALFASCRSNSSVARLPSAKSRPSACSDRQPESSCPGGDSDHPQQSQRDDHRARTARMTMARDGALFLRPRAYAASTPAIAIVAQASGAPSSCSGTLNAPDLHRLRRHLVRRSPCCRCFHAADRRTSGHVPRVGLSLGAGFVLPGRFAIVINTVVRPLASLKPDWVMAARCRCWWVKRRNGERERQR
jgi:hypothetical protein